jgi:hypothetical protein
MTTAISPTGLIEEHFGALKNPRSPYRIEHKMLAIRGCLVSIADAYAFGGALPYAPRFPSSDTPRSARLRRALHQADAMGCQTEIAKTLVEQGADYVLALKVTGVLKTNCIGF